MPSSYIADGFTAATPYIYLKDTNAAIAFYAKAFGATERSRIEGPGGSIMHAEIDIGGAVVMLADANPDWDMRTPDELGGRSSSVFIYVPDVDATFVKVVENGGTIAEEAKDMFWGDRFGQIVDPFGHKWGIATHVEDVAPEDMARRQEAWMKEMAG
ncbi:MAG: VOC family protein [Proteobacteria bacterium]|nr:VOC family protein [Pseudomonadota bacterium]